jgi:predicted AAA+ superfamily ATPase
VSYLARGLGAKVKYANIDRDSNSRDVKQVLDLMIKAGVVLKAVHSQGDGIPLNAQIDLKVFKLYCLDLGLYNRICRLDYLSDRDLREDRFVNEGGLAEQFIAQQFAFSETPLLSPSLNYWLRDGSAGNAEVDFLIQVGRNVVPVEVKSGKSGSLKSLLQFVRANNVELGCRFDLNMPSSQNVSHGVGGEAISFRLVSLPLYLCNQAQRLLRRFY